MHTAVRPWVTTGVAIVGAGVIAVSPVAPLPRVHVPEIHAPAVQVAMPEVQLTATFADLLDFEVLRQVIVNRIDDIATLGVGLALSGAGLGAAIAAIPGTLVTLTQQILTGDFDGALTTIETYLIESGAAIIGPTLGAIIERRERYLAVQAALQTALPTAIVEFGAGVVAAIDVVARAAIEGGTIVADTVLDGDFGNLPGAFVEGTAVFLASFGPAGQALIDGTAAAQETLADALAATPPSDTLESRSAAFSSPIAAVPNLSGGNVAAFNLEPTTTTFGAAEGDQLSTDVSGDDLTKQTETPPPGTADDVSGSDQTKLTETPPPGTADDVSGDDQDTATSAAKVGSKPAKKVTERARDWLKKKASVNDDDPNPFTRRLSSATSPATKTDSIPDKKRTERRIQSPTAAQGVDSAPQSAGATTE